MRIRKEQMEAMAVPVRRQKRAELVRRVADDDPSVQADPEAGTIILTDARGYASTVELSDQGVASVRTAMGREFWLERTADGAPSVLAQRDVTRYDIARTKEGSITEVRHDGKTILEMPHGTSANVIEARFADGAVERLYYEDAEQLTRTVDALGNETHFQRDETGEVVLLEDPRGHVTHFDFDEEGELERTRFPDGTQEEYAAQDDGLLILRNGEPHALVTLEGDDLKEMRFSDGELLQFQFTGGLPVKVANPRHTVAFAYSEEGQLLLDNQDGMPVEIVLDPDGNLAEMKGPGGPVRYQHDGDDLLTEVTAWNGVNLKFSYALSGQIQRIEFPNGVTTTVDALPAGQINGITTIRGRAETRPIVHDTYEYDARGRVTSIQRDQRRRSFQYDIAGRLLGTTENDRQLEQFEYDPAGNRVMTNGRTATFDPMNKLIQDGDQSCAHDRAGNLIRRGGTEFRYNEQGLLIEVIPFGGKPVRFDYDALGRRVSKEVSGQLTRYTWSGRQLLAEVTTRGGLEIERRDYLFYPGEYLPLAVRINGKSYFYHTDRAGTVLAMTDEQGAVVWKADYAAYGEAQIEVEAVRQPLRVLGQYHDAETGLHYNLFRYYDPQLGRYLTPDPIRYAGGSTNLYLFANNDPINQCDPDGHIVIPAALLVIAGAALVGGLIGGAISAASGGSFWKGAAAGAAAGAIGAAAPIIGAAAGLSGAALAAVALAGDAIAGGVEACIEGEASIGTFAKGAGIALATTVATLGLAKIPGVRKALGVVGKKLAGVTNRVIGRVKGALTPTLTKMINRMERQVANRMRKLSAQGHGPQRHEGQVTKQQLEDRAVKGYDPMTGTTTDGVTGGTHKYGKNATKINTPEAYVKGDKHLRESPEFKTKTDAAKANGETRVVVKDSKLEDVYGPGYKDNVTGKTRQGSKNNPTGATDTDFTDGTMTGVYDKDPATGNWNLTTMYPEPKP